MRRAAERFDEERVRRRAAPHARYACRAGAACLALALAFVGPGAGPSAVAAVGDAAVEVRVSDDAGQPVAKAAVTAWSAGFARLARAVTGDDGAVVLRAITWDGARVVVNAEGFAPRQIDVSAAERGVLDVTLETGRTLVVRVEEAGAARPVPTFDVVAMRSGAVLDDPAAAGMMAAGAVRASAQASDGSLAVSGLPDEPVALIVRAPGFPPTPLGPVDPRDTDEARVVLDASGCVPYAVVDGETGEAIAGAIALPDVPLLESVGDTALLELGRSGEQGELTLCPAGRGPARVAIARDGYATVSVEAPRADGGTASRDIVLARAVRLEVRVAYPDGRPVNGALVTVEAGGREHTGRTSGQGVATFDELAADDEARVDVRLADADAPAAEALARLEPGTLHRVSLDVAAALAVTTYFADAPVTDARALLASRASFALEVIASAETGIDGEALLRVAGELPDETVLVVRTDDDALFVEWSEVHADADDEKRFSVDLEGRVVRGRVVSEQQLEVAGAVLACTRRGAATDQPVQGQAKGDGESFRFDRAGRDVVLLRPGSVAVTDARGRFAMRVPSDCGALEVSGPATDDGEAPWGRAQVAWWDAGETASLDVTLSRRSALEIRVDGPRQRMVSVSARPANMPWQVMVVRLGRTGESVRVEVSDEGPWVLVAQDRELIGVTGPVAAPPGRVAELTVTMQQGGTIVVPRAYGEDPRPNVVDERGLDWFLVAGPSLSEGNPDRLSIGPLPLGEYRVIADGEEERVRLLYPGEVKELF